MRVALFTTHFAINYGAVLQAYALQRSIRILGHSCDIVDYRPTNRVDGRSAAYKFDSPKASVYSTLQFLNLTYRANKKRKIEKFDAFLKEHCHLSRRTSDQLLEFSRYLGLHEVLVCGSDQVWNPRLFNESAYHLRFQFPTTDQILVAYAPSVAERIPEYEWNQLASKVQHIDHLSLRESLAARKLEQQLGRKVHHVVDPVFLLSCEDWSDIFCSIPIRTPYVLSYELVSNGCYQDLLKAVKKKTRSKLVNINLKPVRQRGADCNIGDASPGQFVSLFRDARFVCTSSFHGTVFAVLFGKQFVTAPAASRSSRIVDLLDALGLQDRLVDSHSDISRILDGPRIDFEQVEERLQSLRKSSLRYLSDSIITGSDR